MDRQKDFLHCIEPDTSLHIMSCLHNPADLVRASAVSRSWFNFVVENQIAKRHCLKIFPQLLAVAGVVKTGEEPTNSNNIESRTDEEFEILKREHNAFASLLHVFTKSNVFPKDCISNAISASSTDNYPDESVVNTLNPRDRFIRRASYWSSKGQSSSAVSETLIYKLRDGVWNITEIDIQPFEAFFQDGKPIYCSKFVRFRVGYPKYPKELEKDGQNLALSADDKFVWTYISSEFPMMQENRLQPFKLPEHVLSIGGYLQIELLGRVQRQAVDGLFYIRICYVRVLGRPLYPAFEAEFLEPHGKFLLKHDPKNLNSVLQASSGNEIPHGRSLEEEILWERLGLLENLLRGIQEGQNNPGYLDEEEDEDEINAGLIL